MNTFDLHTSYHLGLWSCQDVVWRLATEQDVVGIFVTHSTDVHAAVYMNVYLIICVPKSETIYIHACIDYYIESDWLFDMEHGPAAADPSLWLDMHDVGLKIVSHVNAASRKVGRMLVALLIFPLDIRSLLLN